MSKIKRWSIETAPLESDLLNDMGLAPVNDDSSDSAGPTPTPPTSFPSPAVYHHNNNSVDRTDPADPQNPYALMQMSLDTVEKIPDNYGTYKKRKMCSYNESGFSSFSDELIIHIFSMLQKSSLAKCLAVSKNWHRLASDETLWRRLDLSGKVLKPKHLGIALSRGAHYARCSKIHAQDPVFEVFPQYLPLVYLDLTMAAISVASLNQMLEAARNIKKLSLEHCTIDDVSCQAIAKMRNLDTLNLCMCYGLTGTGINSIAQGCPKLEALNMAWVGLSSNSLELLCENLPVNLNRLNLSGCRNELTDAYVEHICQRCPRLFELDISDAMKLTENAIVSISRSLHHLEFLAASRCYSIPFMAFSHLQVCKSLVHIDVFGSWNGRNVEILEKILPNVKFNQFKFSSIARPTVGVRRTSIWEVRVRT